MIAEEEGAFTSMLSRGIKEFKSRAAAIQSEGGTQMGGEAAFFLYDTMGFPLDLTQLMAREAGCARSTPHSQRPLSTATASGAPRGLAAFATSAAGFALARGASGAETTRDWRTDSRE